MASNPRFLELLEYAGKLHSAKGDGYSGRENPDTWDNFREAENWGVTSLDGCLVRLGDKYKRAQNLHRDSRNDVVGEPFPRTMFDLAAYALIAICLWEESHPGISWQDEVKA